MKTFSILCCIALAFVVGTAGAKEPKDPNAPKKPKTIVDELGFKGFNIFKTAINNAGLADKFNGTEQFTFLAPTDVAFRDLPKVQLDALLADKDKLKGILEQHIIAGRVSSADLKTAAPKTLAGTSLDVKSAEGKIKIGTATVVKPDVTAPNGVIHGVDKLLAVP